MLRIDRRTLPAFVLPFLVDGVRPSSANCSQLPPSGEFPQSSSGETA